jgi:hypothetical protein
VASRAQFTTPMNITQHAPVKTLLTVSGKRVSRTSIIPHAVLGKTLKWIKLKQKR